MVNVIVCDDEPDRALNLGARISAAAGAEKVNVTALDTAQFAASIAVLEARQRDSRNISSNVPVAREDTPIDTADVLLVDYDLLRLDSDDNAPVRTESGERFCYLARCYSSCGVIVGYNQFSYQRTFDLTLRGHIRSFADLNLTSDVADSAGLWSDVYSGFRPWSWPMLDEAVVRLDAITALVAEDPSAAILEALGLASGRLYDLFSREHLELLSPRSDPLSLTFKEFLTMSPIGLRPRDSVWSEWAGARIAAARISKWLERIVLPDQSLLVDAPHLVSRYPSVLLGEPTLENLNRTCQLQAPREGLGLDSTPLVLHEYAAESWLSRPVWIGPDVASEDDIAEVRDPWSAANLEQVFCEDVSRFHAGSDASDFVAEVGPEFSRRYILRVAGVSYEPTVRMLM